MMKSILFAMILLAFTESHAQEVLTFESALEAAMQHNFDIKIAENNESIAITNEHPGATGLLPILNLSAGTNYTQGNTKQTFLTQSEPQEINGASSLRNNASIGISYVLFDGMQNINGFKRLKEEVKRANLQTQFQMEQVALQLAQVYFSIAQAEELLALNKRISNLSSERFKRAVVGTEFGQNKRLELNANIDFITDSISILNTMNDINNLKAQLNVLMGRNVQETFEVERNITLTDDLILDALIAQGRVNNKAVLLAQKGIDLSQIDLKLSKQGNFPTLQANTGYGIDEFNSDAGFLVQNLNYQYFGGLTFNYNFFDGNITRKRTQAASLLNKNAQLTFEQTTLQTERDIINAFNDYQTALTVLQLQGNNLEKVLENFTRTELSYNQGNLTGLEYREAQLAVARAESTILQAKYNAKILEYRLLQLSGNLLE